MISCRGAPAKTAHAAASRKVRHVTATAAAALVAGTAVVTAVVIAVAIAVVIAVVSAVMNAAVAVAGTAGPPPAARAPLLHRLAADATPLQRLGPMSTGLRIRTRAPVRLGAEALQVPSVTFRSLSR